MILKPLDLLNTLCKLYLPYHKMPLKLVDVIVFYPLIYYFHQRIKIFIFDRCKKNKLIT